MPDSDGVKPRGVETEIGDRMLNPTELRAAFDQIHAGISYAPDLKSGPWSFTYGDREWAVTTQGHFLIAVPREQIAGALFPLPAKAHALVSTWVPFQPLSPSLIPVAKLRAFAGISEADADCDRCKNTRRVACDTCDGKGEVECECSRCGNGHDATCAECDGGGVVECLDCEGKTERRASFLGAIVNAALIGKILRIVAANDDRDVQCSFESRCSSVKGGGFDGYVFRSIGGDPEWMALIVRMATYVIPEYTFEEAGSDPARPTGFQARHSDRLRRKSADVCTERLGHAWIPSPATPPTS